MLIKILIWKAKNNLIFINLKLSVNINTLILLINYDLFSLNLYISANSDSEVISTESQKSHCDSTANSPSVCSYLNIELYI